MKKLFFVLLIFIESHFVFGQISIFSKDTTIHLTKTDVKEVVFSSRGINLNLSASGVKILKLIKGKELSHLSFKGAKEKSIDISFMDYYMAFRPETPIIYIKDGFFQKENEIHIQTYHVKGSDRQKIVNELNLLIWELLVKE